jgi:cell division protein FtsL
MARGITPGTKGGGQGKRRRIGGRSLIAIVLLSFFIVATGVIARRTFGINQARSLRALERQRDAVDASRVKLEAEIRDASSRARLVPIAEQRLHMHVPPDSQVIILQRKPK